MLPRRLLHRFDRRRLRRLLIGLFALLALPTGVLIWQAYGQLKWEAFYQHRGSAEALTTLIDTELRRAVKQADARTYSDYSFLVVSGEPSANFLQRSPLSDLPPVEDIPGTIGYFQVDAEGQFSTPVLPPDGTDGVQFGLGTAEMLDRQALADNIRYTLASNRLLPPRSERPSAPDAEQKLAGRAAAEPMLESESLAAQENAEVDAFADSADIPAAPAEKAENPVTGYSQAVFDLLGKSASRDMAAASLSPSTKESGEKQSSGKVADLALDETLALKKDKNAAGSANVERAANEPSPGATALRQSARPLRRREQTALPETVAGGLGDRDDAAIGGRDLRIGTFESEIDPFEIGLLDDGHLVAFRRVWRDGERFIQGALIDAQAFYAEVARAPYLASPVSQVASLAVAYGGDIALVEQARADNRYGGGDRSLEGTLLYRSRLSAPFDGLELIFSIRQLPPGPGARVLTWVSVVLVLVLVGGFLALYRLGLGQIKLARQQQDFVSAVSHELKTPLTSIRMYGEMLREGWADESKRQSYYEFIHDESERLTRLISNVLQLARITRNEAALDLRLVGVARLMDQLRSKLSDQVERAGFTLELDDDTDGTTVIVDQDAFLQVFINLVDNAIKFARNAENKSITVAAQRTRDGKVRFSIRDYGPGIEKGQLRKIFELFYRSESELTRETVGTGIGLAIVQQLTAAMHGDVDVVNADPGARFTLTFPAA